MAVLLKSSPGGGPRGCEADADPGGGLADDGKPEPRAGLAARLNPPAVRRGWGSARLTMLGLAGALSAHLGGSDVRHAVLRVLIGGAVGLACTYAVGLLFGTAMR